MSRVRTQCHFPPPGSLSLRLSLNTVQSGKFSSAPRCILAGAIGTVTSRGKTLVREKRWRNLKVWQRVDNVLFFLYASKAFSFQDADVGSSVFWPGRGSLRVGQRESKWAFHRVAQGSSSCSTILISVVLEHYFAHLENGVTYTGQGCFNSLTRKGARGDVVMSTAPFSVGLG